MSLAFIVDIRQFWIGFSWHSDTRRLIVMLLPGVGLMLVFP